MIAPLCALFDNDDDNFTVKVKGYRNYSPWLVAGTCPCMCADLRNELHVVNHSSAMLRLSVDRVTSESKSHQNTNQMTKSL